ncbi:MAG TPA: aliphatic sulfonate ABC transporter substrate-binding protein [Chthoniobacterales bacterium]
MRFFLRALQRAVVLLLAWAPTVHAAAPPKLVRIGYQKSSFLLLVRSERTLEKRLESLGYSVEWHEFTSGPPLLEALNGGAIDFGHTGQPPPIFAQASGVPLVYVATTESSPDNSGLLVAQSSPLRTVADLKGKRLAFARGSSSHLFVVQRLAQAGLALTDVKSVYLQPPEARAAFQAGAVDAWAVWDPFFSAAELQLNARTLATGQGLTGFREFYFTSRAYLQGPAAETLPVILATLREAGQRVRADVKGTASFLADKLGIPAAVLERSEARTQYHTLLPITPEVVAEQQGVADTFTRLGIIPKPIRVSDDVYNGVIPGL